MISKHFIYFCWGVVFDCLVLMLSSYPIALGIAAYYGYVDDLSLGRLFFLISIISPVWILFRIFPAIKKLLSCKLREDISLTYIESSEYITRCLKPSIIRAFGAVLMPLIIILIVFTFYSYQGKIEFLLYIVIILLFCLTLSTWLFFLAGIFHVVANYCRNNLISESKAETVFYLQLIIVLFFTYLAGFGLHYLLSELFYYLLPNVSIYAKFSISTFPVVIIAVIIVRREWGKLCSVYFKFEEEEYRKIYSGWF